MVRVNSCRRRRIVSDNVEEEALDALAAHAKLNASKISKTSCQHIFQRCPYHDGGRSNSIVGTVAARGIGYMPLSKRLFADDEELGKKNDDHRPVDGAMAGSTLRTWRGPRRKRVLIGIAILYLLYLFVKYIPTDVPPVSKRIDTRFGIPNNNANPQTPLSPQVPPPRSSKPSVEHYFDGPIKFYELTASLGYGMGQSRVSRNVLFAASSLKSASHIVPLACDMSKQNRNRVHFAIMGREKTSIEDIKQLNGISETDCSVQWHDARPDYAPWSSDFRMEVSVRAALGHIHKSMRPQVLFADTSMREDGFFSKAIKDKSNELGITAIELPSNAIENLPWLAKLDSASLNAMNSLEIEILIHAPSESSGSLLRLLKSLENADYAGFPYPRMTIDLPPSTDQPTKDFLKDFRWPPESRGADSKLTVRHRVNPTRLTPAEASIHFVESFYPAHVANSHVLVLTSQAELSQSYYQYLIFSLLEYKYSASAPSNADKLLGISLELPTLQLDGRTPFQPPIEDETTHPSPLFLWQAPNSNAALYFGDKWVEFHSFLSNRLHIQPAAAKYQPQAKFVSEKYPAWTEYLLELIWARGYSMLYPSFASHDDSALVTVHYELYQAPEEFMTVKSSAARSTESKFPHDLVHSDGTLTAQSEIDAVLQVEKSTQAATSSILVLLFPGFAASLDYSGVFALPSLTSLGLLSYTGGPISPSGSLDLAQAYAEKFRLEYGGCKQGSKKVIASTWSSDDLFCLDEPEIATDIAPNAG